MEGLISKLIDKRVPLIDAFGKHGLIVEKKLAERRLKKANEGIVPDTDKDSEQVVVDKLTEGPREEEPERFSEAPSRDREGAPPPPPEEVKEEEPKEEELDKEYMGRKEETYFYLIRSEGEGEEEGGGDLQIVDQEGKLIYSASENDLDSSDVFHFLVAAIRDVAPEEVSREMFTKYVIPKIEELEREEGEYVEDDELASQGDDTRSGEEAPFESIHEVRITFDRRHFDVALVDESGPQTVISINGKKFEFSNDFADVYREDGHITEDKLKELALDALGMMDDAEFDHLAAHPQTKERCKKKKKKMTEDISVGVKDLQKKAEQAIKDDDFVTATELCQRLSVIQQALPEEIPDAPGVEDETPPPIDDELVSPAEEEPLIDDELEPPAEEEVKDDLGSLVDDEEKDKKKKKKKEEGVVPDDKDSERTKIDKLTEEEKKKKTKEGVEPDFKPGFKEDDEKTKINKLTETCKDCGKEEGACKCEGEFVPKLPKRRREL